MDEYKEWLKHVGIVLPEKRLERLASKISLELDLRVGSHISDQLSDEQLEEFDAVLEEANRKQEAWLMKHYPDYAAVVEAEKKQILKELEKAKHPAVLIKRWHQSNQ